MSSKIEFTRCLRIAAAVSGLCLAMPWPVTGEETAPVAVPESDLAGPPAADTASRADASLDELVDELNHASLQEAFRILRSDYIKRESLSYLEMNRAAMQGLLERLDFGAMLLTRAGREASDSPFQFRSEKLSDEIGYVRFGKFKKEEIEALDKALVRFSDEASMHTLIVDLRSPQAMADFEIASSILSRFRPVGEVLFKIRRPHEERPRLFTSRAAPRTWKRDLVVLIDRETGNVGEIIAEVLRERTGSLVIGEKTVGMTVEYRDIPVGEDRILRYAVAEVVLPDGESLFQKGVEPDVVTPSPTKVKQAIFRASEEVSLSTFVFDRGRPRMNEAALVAGTDPELNYYVARSSGKETPWDKPMLRDRVLRQAVDLLTVSRFLPAKSGGEAEAASPRDEAKDAPAPEREADEPAKDEPTKSEPAKSEPAKSEPAKDEPAKDEPAKSEPAKSEPAKSEPAKSEPTDPGDPPAPAEGESSE